MAFRIQTLELCEYHASGMAFRIQTLELCEYHASGMSFRIQTLELCEYHASGMAFRIRTLEQFLRLRWKRRTSTAPGVSPGPHRTVQTRVHAGGVLQFDIS